MCARSSRRSVPFLLAAAIAAPAIASLNTADPSIINLWRLNEQTSGELINNINASFLDTAPTGTPQNHEDFYGLGPDWTSGSAYDFSGGVVGDGIGLSFTRADMERTRVSPWYNVPQGNYTNGSSFTIMLRLNAAELTDNLYYDLFGFGSTAITLAGASPGGKARLDVRIRDGGVGGNGAENYWTATSYTNDGPAFALNSGVWTNLFVIYNANTSITLASDDGTTFLANSNSAVPDGFNSLVEGFSDSDRRWFIGALDSLEPNTYDGLIESIVVWDRALTPAEAAGIGLTNVTVGPASASWNVDADGAWSVGTNWNPATAPNGAGAIANFGTIITSAHTVTLDAAQTVGQINFSSPIAYTIAGTSTLTLDGGSGSTSINVTDGSHVIDAPIVLAKDTTVSVSGGGALSVQHVRGAGLSVASGAMKILAKGAANDATGTSVVTSLSVGSGASLDLTNNSMVIDYSSVGTLVDDTRQMLQSGKLTTSSSGGKLGYADNAVLHLTSFAGQTVDDGNLLVKFTYGGDANLDGQVDISDLGALATAWQTSAPWTGGDFDYSGFVDISDLGILATNWQLGVGSPLGPSFDEALASVGLSGVSVPEPATIGALGMCLAGVLASRPRHASEAAKR